MFQTCSSGFQIFHRASGSVAIKTQFHVSKPPLSRYGRRYCTIFVETNQSWNGEQARVRDEQKRQRATRSGDRNHRRKREHLTSYRMGSMKTTTILKTIICNNIIQYD